MQFRRRFLCFRDLYASFQGSNSTVCLAREKFVFCSTHRPHQPDQRTLCYWQSTAPAQKGLLFAQIWTSIPITHVGRESSQILFFQFCVIDLGRFLQLAVVICFLSSIALTWIIFLPITRGLSKWQNSCFWNCSHESAALAAAKPAVLQGSRVLP